MSKRPYFSQYESPNIVIVPTVSFCGASAKKKMKLSLHVDEVQPKNGRTLEKGTCSSSTLENNCSSSKNTNSSNISMATNNNINIIHANPIKLNRLTQDSKPSDKISKLSESNEKSSMREENNKQNNLVEKENKKHISQSSIEVEINLDSKAHKDIANTKKNSLKTINKNSGNSTNKKKCNNEGTRLKSAENISSSHKDKKHSKPDKISAHKRSHVSRHVTKEISEKCDKNTDSKISKNRHKQSDKLIKQDSHDQCRAEQQKCKKSCQDKIPHKSRSEKLDLGKTILMDDININYGSNRNEPKQQGCKKDHASKCKHIIERHSDKKVKHHSISKSKHTCKTKSTLTNQEKCKIQKASEATKYNTNSIISRKCPSNDRDKSKKHSSTNKAANNKTHKLKSSRSDSDNKNKKQIRAMTSSNPSHKDSLIDSYENLTVTVKTQSEKHKNAAPPKTNVVNTTHKSKKIKLIINFIVKNSNNASPTHDESCTKKEDNISLISNSELSFLDDINIDEIVDSLKQPKREPGTKEQDSTNLNRSLEGPVIVVDDDSDVENDTVYKKNNGLENSEALVKVLEDDKLKDIKPIKGNIFTTHFSNNYIDLSKESNPNPSTNNTLILPVENITNREIIDSQMDIEECNGIPENKTNSTQSAVYNTPTEIKAQNIECTEQISKIVSVNGTESTEIFKDPIEAQLKRIFEMPSSDTFDTEVDNNIRENDRETEITCKKEPELITSSPQNQEQCPIVYKDRGSPNNAPNDIEPSTIKEIREINKPVNINATVVHCQEPNIDNNFSINVDGAKETEITCKEEPQEITALPQNEDQNSVGHNYCGSPDNTKNDDVACSTLQDTSYIVNTPIRMNATDSENQKPNIDNTMSKNVDSVKETEITCEEKPEEIASLSQNEEQHPIEHKDSGLLDNTKNDDECSTMKKTNDNVTTSVKINATVAKSLEFTDRTLTAKLLKSVKSEIRKVEEQKLLPVTQAQNFIKALEARMSTFLKTQYTVTTVLHKGKHSRIYECIDKGGFNYALKMLKYVFVYFIYTHTTRIYPRKGVQRRNQVTNFSGRDRG
ncbi:hypothetical protein O3G_MSEX013471 [Manduca sexta]|uniref:Uncharacterized protein n=1 Tax=Manduca sexta TaxID=7130 RepID=A0A921ZRA5_MANSE|nr:hypothetical protein O3G_MSEX013471 [Manduca sexta]